MKLTQGVAAAIAASLIMSGCATKHYGRLAPLTSTEMAAYNCHDIDMEIARAQGFRQQVHDGSKVNVASVMGFLGDWGIGNANEKNTAINSYNERVQQLYELRSRHGCGASVVDNPRPAPSPPEHESPTLPPRDQSDLGPHMRCVTCR